VLSSTTRFHSETDTFLVVYDHYWAINTPFLIKVILNTRTFTIRNKNLKKKVNIYVLNFSLISNNVLMARRWS